MNNQEKFKQTFDQIHAPEALLGKVMDMQTEKKEFKTRNLVKVMVCALALGLGLFGAGNGICYAATGESLVTTMKVIINGEETMYDVEWKQQGNVYHGNITIPNEDGSSVTVLTVSDDIPENMDVTMDISKEETVGEDGVTEEETVEIEIKEEEKVQSFIYDSSVVSEKSDEDMDVSE